MQTSIGVRLSRYTDPVSATTEPRRRRRRWRPAGPPQPRFDWLPDVDERCISERGWQTIEQVYKPVVLEGRTSTQVALELGLAPSTVGRALRRATAAIEQVRLGRVDACPGCGGPIAVDKRADAKTCSERCAGTRRVRRHRRLRAPARARAAKRAAALRRGDLVELQRLDRLEDQAEQRAEARKADSELLDYFDQLGSAD
jgi:hypothetical protein